MIVFSKIQKLEARAGGSSVNIYFNRLSVNSTSFKLAALRNTLVYRDSTSNIEIFDLYDTGKLVNFY